MIRRIALSVLWAAALLLPVALRAEDAMDLRWFPLTGNGESFIRERPTPESTKAEDARLMNRARDLGVQFPPGSYLHEEHDPCRMLMFNTPPNHRKLARILADQLSTTQVEIDVAFVDFPPEDIAKAAREQVGAVPTNDQLKQLWRSGHGRLLAATKTVERDYKVTGVKGVGEVIYPSGFRTDRGGSNAVKKLAFAPFSFATRETGAIVDVVPVVDANARTIYLTLVPEFCTEGEPSDVTIARHDRKNGDPSLVVQHPRFHSRNASTDVVLRDGSTVVLGGLLNRGGDQWCYMFITARLLDAKAGPASDYEGYPMDEE